MHTKSVLLSSIGLLGLIAACDYGAPENELAPALEVAPAADEFYARVSTREVVIRSNNAPEKVFYVTQRKDRDADAIKADPYLPRQKPAASAKNPVRRGDRLSDLPNGQVWFVSEDWMRVYVAEVWTKGQSESSSYSEGGRTDTVDVHNTTVYIDIPAEPKYDFTPPPPPEEPTEEQQGPEQVEERPRPAGERPNWQKYQPWGEFRSQRPGWAPAPTNWEERAMPRDQRGGVRQESRGGREEQRRTEELPPPPVQRERRQQSERRSEDTTQKVPHVKGVWIKQPDGTYKLVPEKTSGPTLLAPPAPGRTY